MEANQFASSSSWLNQPGWKNMLVKLDHVSLFLTGETVASSLFKEAYYNMMYDTVDGTKSG